jgi:hypothetical protein
MLSTAEQGEFCASARRRIEMGKSCYLEIYDAGCSDILYGCVGINNRTHRSFTSMFFSGNNELLGGSSF